MKIIIKGFIGVFLLFIGINSFSYESSNNHPEDHFSHLPMGGRRALHGMVVFGSGPYFLEHIPTLTPPHDFQIITEVVLKNKNGVSLNLDLSSQGFTLKPSSNFSLNDYVAGRLKIFTASIHQGSFEQGGEIITDLENVTVEILTYKMIRQLPTQEPEQGQWIKLSDGKNTFESNVIRPNQNIQLIRNISNGKKLWCVKAPDFFDSCL
jgi:hypothetical protein